MFFLLKVILINEAYMRRDNMKHIFALLVKFVMVVVVLEIILNMLTNLTFTDILIISIAVTVIAYVIGDILILAVSNNTVATVADIALALATIYMFNFLWGIREISFSDALISAAIIGVGELFFHKFVAAKVLPEHK